MPKTPAEAKALGLTHYFTGEPCSKGHVAKRNAKRATCCECMRLERNRRYAENPKHIAALNNAWKENPDKNAAKERNRRARLRQCGGVHTAEDIAAIRKLQKDRCAVCRVKLNGGGEVDHIQPLLSGGENDRTNLQLLCEFCNRSKGAKDPIDFMQERGKLI